MNRDVDFGILVGMALGIGAMVTGSEIVERFWPETAAIHPPKVGSVELVCFDGNAATIPLTGIDTEISATAFGNGVLWSIPSESGIASIHWQDAVSTCHIRRG